MGAPEKRRDPLWRWIRIVRARPRLFLAILLGLAIAAIAPGDGSATFRPVSPSLEDVFVLLSRRHTGERAA